MNKKLVVVNFTGTVGKTTLAAHLLSPRMPDASFFAVESINQTADGLGVDVEKVRGDQFRGLLKKLMLIDAAIIDVGASNVEDFMINLEGFEQAHEEIDYYIVPVTSGTKEQQETVSMIASLAEIGVPAEKIRVVFNRVSQDVKSEFAIITNYHSQTKCFWMNQKCAVFDTELFDAVSIYKISLPDLLADDKDYKQLLKDKTASAQDRALWSDMYGLQLLAKGVSKKLDAVFEELFS